MEFTTAQTIISSSTNYISHLEFPAAKSHTTSSSYSFNLNKSLLVFPISSSSSNHKNSLSFKPTSSTTTQNQEQAKPTTTAGAVIPTMSDILEASGKQNLDMNLQTLGPFFRVTARRRLEPSTELGRAEGLVRPGVGGGKILHLDSIRLRRETIGMEKSIFGIGLFIGAVAVRFGYDCGCKKAELLAIYDSDLYHSKLVRFYTRIGFKVVGEVTGSSIVDLPHMLVWGGVGTRMDADVHQLLLKWCSRFTTSTKLTSS